MYRMRFLLLQKPIIQTSLKIDSSKIKHPFIFAKTIRVNYPFIQLKRLQKHLDNEIILYFFPNSVYNFFSNAQELDCDDFEFNILSDFYIKIELINNKAFNSSLKYSTTLTRNTNKNIDSLKNEFDKFYKNKITNNCINSKVYNEQDKSIIDFNQCNKKQKIELVDKINHLYIFNLKAFEINNYLLFNTLNNTIYVIDDYPIISDNGNTIFTLKFHTPNSHGAKVYKFEGDKLN